MVITYRNAVSIGEIVVYVPALAVAALLTVRHGLNRENGCFYLIIFSLARIIGPSFQLAATMNDYIDIKLLTGAVILQSIGLSPLMMTALCFLSRAITGINKNLEQPAFPNATQLKFVHVVVTVGLLLGVSGGVKASEHLEKTGRYVPLPESKAGVSLFIIVYILIVLTTILTSFNVSHAQDPDEKHLLVAVALSLPFLLVRIIYSSISTFDSASLPKFNQISGSATVWLVMSVITEIIVVIIFETVGLTLQKTDQNNGRSPTSGDIGLTAVPGAGILGRILGRTIIGRLVVAAMSSGDNAEPRRSSDRR